MSKHFNMFSDPSHAWLEVSLSEMVDVGLTPASFTKYSYKNSIGIFYLEEDCDAGKFMEAYKAKHGDYPALKGVYVNHDSHIRNLRRLGA